MGLDAEQVANKHIYNVVFLLLPFQVIRRTTRDFDIFRALAVEPKSSVL